MPLWGRAGELEVLAGHVRAASLGKGAIVVVEGPAGIGKTRLLGEAARLASASGLAVARCSAAPQAGVPLGTLLAPLAAGERPLAPPGDVDGLDDRPERRYWVLDRLRAALAERARRRPALVSLDAAEWAERPLLSALRALSRACSESPCLLIVARRPNPCTPALERAVAQFDRRGCTRLDLAPLARGAAASLAEDTLGAPPDAALLELVDGAAGNPLYVTGLLTALADEGAVRVEAGRARLLRRYLPVRFAATVRGHVAAISSEAAQLLAGAATLGRVFSLRDVASLLGCPAGRLLPAAAEALRAQLLVEE